MYILIYEGKPDRRHRDRDYMEETLFTRCPFSSVKDRGWGGKGSGLYQAAVFHGKVTFDLYLEGIFGPSVAWGTWKTIINSFGAECVFSLCF